MLSVVLSSLISVLCWIVYNFALKFIKAVFKTIFTECSIREFRTMDYTILDMEFHV